jgi:phospholipase D1/2
MTCRNGENFRVFVTMPLLPAFEGDIGGNGGYAIRTVTHYTYTSISKGGFSLWEKLAKEGRMSRNSKKKSFLIRKPNS